MKTLQLLLVLFLLTVTRLCAQPAPRPKLNARQAKDIAELMCLQLPNVGTILESFQIETPGGSTARPPEEPILNDDVYDALLQLGPYSANCLAEKLLDSRWMPDPRSEPLLGAPLVGDVAYMILGNKGVPDMLPQLARKQPNELTMDEYFTWPSVGDHRSRLQNAVRGWIKKHPNCCGAIPVVRSTEPATWKFRMSPVNLQKARMKLSRLRLGMSPEQVLKITGTPDAIDRGDASSPGHWHTALLGYCATTTTRSLHIFTLLSGGLTRLREEIRSAITT